jgi:predicted ATPase/DNA-binding CsgD family transcriptional regulator
MSRKLELGLTPREFQIACLVRDGLTDREIGTRLFITRRTAEWHLKQVFNKLGVNSRSQVAAWVAHEQAIRSTTDSPSRRLHNLPLQLTTFIGRRNAMAEVQRLLATKRLVTLAAVGGAGKTRLALEVASRSLDRYPDGAWFVDLAPIKDGHLVLSLFGSALGVHERPRQPMAETLIEHLRDRHLLLVVDNCEHVIEDCAGVVDSILRSCPNIFVLATSREPLRVDGETVWRLPQMDVPDMAAPIDLHELGQYEAVGLFLDRAQLGEPGFEISAESAPAVALLCRRLDGIPLAIELAAARSSLMSADQILARLEGRFGFLTGGSRVGPTRHRSLQAALDWSYELLSNSERTLFRRLSVFAGSFSLEAVERVCCDNDLDVVGITDLLGSLVDKSLVIADGTAVGTIRFRMLETLQQFGHERLTENEEVEPISRRHCELFVSVAEETAPELRGRDQQVWHHRLAQDIGNLRLALEWSSRREPQLNLRLSVALTPFWHLHGLDQEGDAWFKRVLAENPARNKLRAQALEEGGLFSYWRDDFDGTSARWHECLELYRELGDRKGVGRALARVAEVAEWHGDFELAHRYYDDGLAMSRETEDAQTITKVLSKVGRLAIKEGNHERARTYLEESISSFGRSGDLREVLIARGYLGLNAVESGDFAAARSQLREAITIARSLDFTFGVATTLMYFAALAAAQSHPVRALHIAGSSQSLGESTGGTPIRITRPVVQRWLDRSRRALGPTRSAACWAEGRAMTRERAIEYALKG